MFEGTLKDLKCVLVGPTALPGKTRRTSEILNPQAREHAIQSIDKERRDIIGDFENTLYQCRILLDENAKYSRGQKANFFTNAVWHYGGNQEKATSLRTRLQFHAVKVSFICHKWICEL